MTIAGATSTSDQVALSFLNGGGEMGARMRKHDWSISSLGSPANWPQALRTMVRVMLNTGHPMYIWWGSDGACLYNDAYRESIGPERHPGSLGRPAREVWEEIWDIIGPQIEQVRSGGGPTWHVDHLVPITRHGRREDVYWTYSYSPIDDDTAANGIGGVLVVCTETTKNVLGERRLAKEIERQRRLFQSAPGFFAVLTGRDHVFEFVNDAYIRLLGDRKFIGRAVREVVPEVEGQGYFELLDRVFDTGERFVAKRNPIRIVRTPGGLPEDRFLDFIYEPVVDEAGKVTGIFVEGHDVTEQTLAEAALREVNADLERKVIERTQARGLVWQVSPDLMGALNSKGYFETSNPAWKSVLGWSEEEVAHMSIFELLHPDDVERTRAGFELTQIGQPAIRFPNRYRCKDGGYRWISWVGVPEDGMVYCSGRDITEEKEAEAQLLAAQEALRQSQKMEAVGQLTGGIAHDFNNLLAGISGSLETLAARIEQGRTSGLERYIMGAQSSARKAAALTQRLLAFSRQQTLDPRPTDINRLIGGMEDLIRRTVGPGIAVEVVGAGGLWPTRIDSSQLESALLNLCINARDAIASGNGRVTVETANKWLDDRAAQDHDVPPGQYVSLCVTDTGTGMTPAIIEKVFDPFFTTKPIGEGTGLGLSMVYGFVRQSGGQVRIYSEVGKGTTVCLYLPRYTGKAEEIVEIQSTPTLHRGDGETVLVIDDEPLVRMLVVEVLEESGYAALEAEDGPSGLKILQSDARIDLLVTDVGLPGGISGRQVADTARLTRPKLKILFITGFAENAVVGNGHLDPGMEVITKPFVFDALAAKIRDLLDRP